MHSSIFQIMRGGYDPDERISEDVFYEQLDSIPADYVSDMDEDEEKEELKWLAKCLPKSMFRCKGREITFLGGDEGIIAEWKGKIAAKLNAATTSQITKGEAPYFYLYDIENAFDDILNIGYRFYSSEDGYCKKSTHFLFDCLQMKPGTKFYIGAIIDYHY